MVNGLGVGSKACAEEPTDKSENTPKAMARSTRRSSAPTLHYCGNYGACLFVVDLSSALDSQRRRAPKTSAHLPRRFGTSGMRRRLSVAVRG
jgi:hypothetical protein